ncbi:MAG: MBL fold metallo-hydrolase [Desulfovibrio sp.]|nr:MBL fold metallo-hydrolase [Desulfovibrio sp.]
MPKKLLLFCLLVGSAFLPAQLLAQGQSKPATEATRQVLSENVAALDFADQRDFEDARRGLIAPLPDQGRIVGPDGKETWNLDQYRFLTQKGSETCPATVNPSLWRQARLVMVDGLFKVCERIYQVRNADISNMTIIEGDTGLIIVDPLVSAENAAAALKLYYAHRPHKPVKYVMYSHSHVDHYGGVEGVTSVEEVQAGKVAILAPKGFMEAAVAENVMAGTAMSRRAMFMYGTTLPPSPQGHVGAGLGLKNSYGSKGLIPPTDLIQNDGESRNLDGLSFVFLLAPNTEAPAEMHWYIAELKALTAAENCVHTMHNLYTLRGAKTRDPLKWANALEATLARFGDKTEVLYGMHHWPVWGKERVRELLTRTSDLYRYIHDQTLHLANQGLTANEIAEQLHLPPALAKTFALRGYYGSLNHNSKAVYNLYLGWFDGNPAHLYPLPPVAQAKKYVEYMGGSQAILERARADFARGEYRWVAEVLNQLVFAEPKNTAARELEADALEQLGYQSESGPWRNFYLTGAQELRQGSFTLPKNRPQNNQAQHLPLDLYFASLGIRLDGKAAWGKTLTMRILVPDEKQEWLLYLRNAVLHAEQGHTETKADLTLTASKREVMALFEKLLTPAQAVAKGLLQGESVKLQEFLPLLDNFTPDFAIVEP